MTSYSWYKLTKRVEEILAAMEKLPRRDSEEWRALQQEADRNARALSALEAQGRAHRQLRETG